MHKNFYRQAKNTKTPLYLKNKECRKNNPLIKHWQKSAHTLLLNQNGSTKTVRNSYRQAKKLYYKLLYILYDHSFIYHKHKECSKNNPLKKHRLKSTHASIKYNPPYNNKSPPWLVGHRPSIMKVIRAKTMHFPFAPQKSA